MQHGLQRLLLLQLLLLLHRGTSALDLWINRGKLSNVKDSMAAITQLSKNFQQSTTWWQLADADWHPQAFWRFMVLGSAPSPSAAAAAAAEHPRSAAATNESELLRKGALSATREAAVAEYVSSIKLPSTGSIDIVAWALMYNCLSEACDVVAPVIVTPAASTPGEYSYGTLWQQLYSSSSNSNNNRILLSATTASIYNRTVLRPLKSSSSSSRMSFRVATQEQLRQCKESLAFGRSPLSAAYELMPGRCYHTLPSVEHALKQKFMFAALEDQPHSYNWPYVPAPLEQCRAAPVLIKKLEDFRACAFSAERSCYYCSNFTFADYQGTDCEVGPEANKVRITISNFMLVYSLVNNQTSAANVSNDFSVVNESVPGSPCDISNRARVALYSSEHNGYSIFHSIWEDTNGRDTQEFGFGRASGDFCYYGVRSEGSSEQQSNSSAFLQRCYVSVTLNSSVRRCETTAADGKLLEVLLNETVTAFAEEHNTAFTVDFGPPTDLFTSCAALVTTAVSVMTATIPCTNVELEYMGPFIYPCKHHKLKTFKFCSLALLNVLLGMILYTPIFAMLFDEANRGRHYHTWSLVNSDVRVNYFGTQMRTILVVEGTSRYQSSILVFFLLVCAISFPLIAGLTLRRCHKVFYRRELLLQECGSDGRNLEKRVAKEINLKAVEMGASEMLRLKSDLRAKRARNGFSADLNET